MLQRCGSICTEVVFPCVCSSLPSSLRNVASLLICESKDGAVKRSSLPNKTDKNDGAVVGIVLVSRILRDVRTNPVDMYDNILNRSYRYQQQAGLLEKFIDQPRFEI